MLLLLYGRGYMLLLLYGRGNVRDRRGDLRRRRNHARRSSDGGCDMRCGCGRGRSGMLHGRRRRCVSCWRGSALILFLLRRGICDERRQDQRKCCRRAKIDLSHRDNS
jgi:hypothetical protein